MKKTEITNIDLFNYFSGHATEEEIEQIHEWLEKNYAHQQEFILQKKIYIESCVNSPTEQLQAQAAFEKFTQQIEISEKSNRVIRKRPARWSPFLKIAATIAILLTLSISVYFIFQKQQFAANADEYYEIEAPYGSKSSIRLPDGSRIVLNAGSKLTYHKNFSCTNREVHLIGEAYFDVEKHTFPMIVNTSHIAVKVLGTKFNLKSYPDEDYIETTLVEGSIQIEAITGSNNPVILLNPNERIVYHKPNNDYSGHRVVADNYLTDSTSAIIPEPMKSFNLARNIDVSTSISWKDGKYLFRGESLENLAIILNRKFDVTIIFEDEEVKDYTYSGTIADIPIEQVLDALKLTSPINYKILEKKVFLSLDLKTANAYKRALKELP